MINKSEQLKETLLISLKNRLSILRDHHFMTFKNNFIPHTYVQKLIEIDRQTNQLIDYSDVPTYEKQRIIKECVNDINENLKKYNPDLTIPIILNIEYKEETPNECLVQYK